MKLIKGDWMTRHVALETDREGSVKFRGFYGKYQIKITEPDQTARILEIHLKEGEDNQWVIEL